MDDQDLARLAVAAADGDLRATEDLLRGLHSHLMAVLHLLGVPIADIDDLAQEVTLQLYRSLGRYDAAQPFLPWMRSIARHRVANYWRGRSRRERRLAAFRARAVALLESAPGTGIPDGERLRTCIDALQERQHAIVQQHYFEGRTSATVAADLGMSAAAVRKALVTIRAALRRCVEADRGR